MLIMTPYDHTRVANALAVISGFASQRPGADMVLWLNNPQTRALLDLATEFHRANGIEFGMGARTNEAHP